MSILTADNLSLSFGAFDVFKGISLTIAADSKIGMIGPNGIGKTSLLLLLAGMEQPTTGSINIARGRRIGYLRQEAVEVFGERSHSVYQEVQSIFAHLRRQEFDLHKMEAQMSNGSYSDELLADYGRLQMDFEQAGGYDYDLRIQQTLEGLGLGKETWDMPLRHLSGGQKTRVLLARLLLEKPDLLMLDEPTNHLDIEAVEWLENTLNKWEGAVLIVSHDRYFLDNTVNTIWEMSRSGIDSYSGNYSSYLLQREQRWDYYERVFAEEKARLLKEVDYIQRNWVRDSTHAQAMGRLRRLSRDIAIVENYGIMALRSGKKWSEFDLHVDRPLDVVEAVRAVNAVTMSSNRPPRIKPRLKLDISSGTNIIRVKEATIGYPDNTLFAINDLYLRRGECAALIGPNGSGKTTFLKVLLGKMEPLDGSIRLGASLKIGYFAQAHDALNGDHSVLEELGRHKGMDQGTARSYLAQYLFRGDDVFKPVSALSGGERARLALAILALDGANFLLLDEPTNHLDIPAREALQEVLESYTGTILLVSHDRYLIDSLATQIWELRESSLQIFNGTYREFILRRTTAASTSKDNHVLLGPRPMVRDNSKQTRQRELDLELLEERIRAKEKEMQSLSRELERSGKSQAFEHMHELSWKVARVQIDLDELMAEWEKVAA